MPVESVSTLERDAHSLDEALVAPCCFTQQVSVHHSQAAEDVRKDVRVRLAAGETRQQILDAYVGMYGKRILAEPPPAGFDLTLYVAPALLLVAGAAAVARYVTRAVRTAPLVAGDASGIDAGLAERIQDELDDLD